MIDILNAAGGLALFMLAMAMMTDGLKQAAGGGLRDLLRRWTSNPLRGAGAGALVTGVLQSSSATTIAVLGFVNAGVINLNQALGVVYGANLGTTMTGWLVSLTGAGFPIERLALPMLAAGVLMRFTAPGPRLRGLGVAITGFGLFFLGLSVLKAALAGAAAGFGAAALGEGAGGLAAFFFIGLAITVLTQSSSASIALILTAAASGAVGLPAAAAAVIGANLGTTSTAAFAAIGATAAARRVALGDGVFKLVAAITAFALLPFLLAGAGAFEGGAGGSPVITLALFHTAFNLVAVIVMLPLIGVTAGRLERLFHSEADDIARPRHLDRTLKDAPVFALAALREELIRLREAVTVQAERAVKAGGPGPKRMAASAEACMQLSRTIADYTTQIRMQDMPLAAAEEMPRLLRAGRYLEEGARLGPGAAAARAAIARLSDESARETALAALDSARSAILAAAEEDGPDHDAAREAALETFETAYQTAKAAALSATARRRTSIDDADALLDALSLTRRLTEQMVKADRVLRESLRAEGREARVEDSEG